jgi:peptide/nickel transport system substrate-binding protein
VTRAITVYPYDPRRAEQLLNEAGLRKDRDGLYASEAGARFEPNLWVTDGTQTERQLLIMTDTWQRAGIGVQPYVIPAAQARDNQVRSTYPGILCYGISPSVAAAMESLTSSQIGTASNRWGGQNRGGWSSPTYDRLFDTFSSTLDQPERLRLITQSMKLISDEVPTYPLFPNLGAVTHLSVLKGPEPGTPETLVHWNIHEWELR